MNKKLILLIILLLGISVGAMASEVNYNVIPMPQNVVAQKGAFTLNANVKISYPKGDADMARNAQFLKEYVKHNTGIELQTLEGGKKGIVLKIDKTIANSEGYTLTVKGNGVTIAGSTPAGVFYGIQTLRKSIPVENAAVVKLPAVTLTDAPRFAYRGTMLDVCRHFFPVDSVKQFIDVLALHNVNRMHWHLSEDQGWRIEIKSLPRLTEIGQWRMETMIKKSWTEYDGKPYGGYYTQEQIKDIIKYAADRYITIIPEIDMPGHMLAALTAYPNLGCTGGPYAVWTHWGVSRAVLCAGNDDVLKFIETVLNEVIDLFPSEYIHVGGDECPKDLWKECPKCQARIKQLGIKGDSKHSAEEYLQSFIIKHAEKVITKRGRKLIGWDEILEGGLAPSATVMSWRGEAGGIEAANLDHDVIMTPNTYLYFDYYQVPKDQVKNEPYAIGGSLPVEHVYNYEPLPAVLSPERQKHIVGVQCNLWTEYIPTISKAEYMLLPRLAALCETQWSPKGTKDYPRFLDQLPRLAAIYDSYGYSYGKHVIKK